MNENSSEKEVIISSSEFKLHLGRYMTQALNQPIKVKRREDECVFISKEYFDRLTALENQYWLDQAQKNMPSEYHNIEKSMEILESALNQSQ